MSNDKRTHQDKGNQSRPLNEGYTLTAKQGGYSPAAPKNVLPPAPAGGTGATPAKPRK